MKTMTPFKSSLLFVLLFCLFFVPAYFLNDNNRNIDDTSYLSHAFTLGIDFDVDYSNEVAIRFNQDKNIPSHFIGTGALVAPFVSVFSILDRINDHPVLENRYSYYSSWSYFGFLFGISFYFLLGVYFLYQFMTQLFGNCRNVFLLAVFGSGVLYYVLGRFMMTHGVEFFATSAIMFFSYKLFFSETKKSDITYGLLIGFFSILSLWIRQSNYHILLIGFIVLLFLSIYYKKDISLKKYLYVIAGIFVFLIPFFLFNLHYFHSIFPSTYQVHNRDILNDLGMPKGLFQKIYFVILLLPNMFLVLFSSEVGVLYSSPAIVLGLIGFVFFFFKFYSYNRKRVLLLFGLTFFAFAFPFAIVLVWKTTASDYGYRYLFALIPISILGLMYFYTLFRDNAIFKYGILIIMFVGVINLFFYKTTPKLSPSTQINVYGKLHEASLKNYEVNLMTELFHIKTWILAGGKTYFGFLVAKEALKTDLISLVPDKIKNKYLERFENIPIQIYIQTIVLLLLWAIFGYIFRQRIKD